MKIRLFNTVIERHNLDITSNISLFISFYILKYYFLVICLFFYRLIPPVFSTCSNSKGSTETFFKMEPSEISSGCFLAILAREVS